ncbi:Nup120p NDAI_0B01430 [Naumovozyma dairenensis CBS 421]|uniref:Uncharacterized protein n=1 Tax=Naumovozyma dairenensis (strain ATCC 10597 / BCRC 20456 / CBS 421 / NBRC 0211 / NRRL Y-12639) TaxID=1071378 RepID=G0W5W6_NAUDC|nr:hypothetical protein NDAI_0B01430 [Naumovozyma dairenensis CBS 421]CCD23177.1 hypothetical protein NDAI_0B01430 [Naumovozyma dairenensis CBS 421]
MSYLSKIDVDLTQFNDQYTKPHVVNLFLDGQHSVTELNTTNTLSYFLENDYSNTIRLSNGECICYQLSIDYKKLTIYRLTDPINGKTICIHFPDPIMNSHHHMLTVLETDNSIDDPSLMINTILTNGIYLTIKLPIDYLITNSSNDINISNYEWFNIQRPYDFTIRSPHMLMTISEKLSVICLDDGGLLGLVSTQDDGKELQPILFNDNSYLKSVATLLFRRNKDNITSSKAISYIVFEQKFLIILTQSCHLKIWNLSTFILVQNYELPKDFQQQNTTIRGYDLIGSYLSIFNNNLAIFLPFENGMFQLGNLLFDSNGNLSYTPMTTLETNLPTSSIWSLCDMKLLRPFNLSISSSYLNLVLLWKSGSLSKLQILNITDNTFKNYQWIEATNKSLSDIQSELLQDIDSTDPATTYFNLKARYSMNLFQKAEQILNENNMTIIHNDLTSNHEYLTNLETILRDLKIKCDEASSLTIYNDDIIMINCLQRYNHSVYKINSSLEHVFYNINSRLGQKNSDILRYWKILNEFSSLFSKETLSTVSEKFINIVTNGSMKSVTSLQENFNEIFQLTIKPQLLDTATINTLFQDLNSIDIVSLLNDLINNYIIISSQQHHNLVNAIQKDRFSMTVCMSSLQQSIIIQKKIIFEILLSFIALDFDFKNLQNQLNDFLKLYYNQNLFLQLYKQDKFLLMNDINYSDTIIITTASEEFNFGIKLQGYSDLDNYLEYVTNRIYNFPIEENPLFFKFFEMYVIKDKTRTNNIISSTSESFLKYVHLPFYIHNNETYEFMLAMDFFICGDYKQSFEFFQKHEYTSLKDAPLPQTLRLICENEAQSTIWSPLIYSFKEAYKYPLYQFELAKLFSKRNSMEFALRAIKKSIEYSMQNVELNVPSDFTVEQYKLHLDLLIHFNMFNEVLDVLRLSHDILSTSIRTRYYKELLDDNSKTAKFFSTLLNSCQNGKDGLYLPPADYKIVDQIFLSYLSSKNWIDYKKLYGFRMANKQERAAAEIIFHYLIKLGNDDPQEKRKCYLIIINILSTFEDEYDQWLLSGNSVVTLTELKHELKSLY